MKIDTQVHEDIVSIWAATGELILEIKASELVRLADTGVIPASALEYHRRLADNQG